MGQPRAQTASAAADAHPAPTGVALLLRPAGYLLVALVWTAVCAVVLVLPWGALAAVTTGTAGPSTVDRALLDPLAHLGDLALVVLLLVPLWVVVMGPLLTFHLPAMSLPLCGLAWVFVGRSLRPSYRDGRLSFSTWQSRAESLGPAGFGSVALSLQPVRRTPATDALMRWYTAGWRVVDLRASVAAIPAGAAWTLLVPVVSPEYPVAVRLVCLALAVVGFVVTVVLVRRAVAARFAGAATPLGARAVSSLDAAELAERRRQLEKRRSEQMRRTR